MESPEICCIDAETTGLDDNDQIVELGAVILTRADDGLISRRVLNHLVKPSIPIPPQASGVHHITDAMVADAPDVIDVFQEYCFDYFVAHNAAFDKKHLGHLGGYWICTLRCAYHLWHEAPSYGLQPLTYWLGLPRPPASAGQPHRATYDAWCVAELFLRLLESGMTVREMINISNKPRMLRTVEFGKHAGTPFRDLPRSYIKWMRDQPDWDEDVRYTINQL